MAVVRRNLPVFGLLALICLLPLVDFENIVVGLGGGADADVRTVLNVVRTGYFGMIAVVTVYLGAQRQDIGQLAAPVSGERALAAPVFAAGTLGVLYVLIKYTDFDPGTAYRFFACGFGWICVAEVTQEIFGISPLGPVLVDFFQIDEDEEQQLVDQQQQQTETVAAASSSTPPLMSQPVSGETEFDRLQLRGGGLPAAVVATVLVVVYWLGVSMEFSSIEQLRRVATANNVIATSIALASLGQIAVESYMAGAGLLAGLFFYDALSVFQSDTMITVATKIEAPVKLLFAGAALPEVAGKYPFGVLGLGDIVVPGIFLSMLREFDIENFWLTNAIITTTNEGKGKGKTGNGNNANTINEEDAVSIDYFQDATTPYFTNGMISYAIGLGATFFVLYSTGQGQPALFYIVPSLLLASVATAASRNEVSKLWSYKGARATKAKEVQEKWKQEREQEKAAATAASNKNK